MLLKLSSRLGLGSVISFHQWLSYMPLSNTSQALIWGKTSATIFSHWCHLHCHALAHILWSWLGRTQREFLDVIFLSSDVILVTLPMTKYCQTCFNFTAVLTTIFSSTFYVDGIFFSPEKTMWDGASALFLAAQNGHSRFVTLMAILAIGKPADKMMAAALKDILFISTSCKSGLSSTCWSSQVFH